MHLELTVVRSVNLCQLVSYVFYVYSIYAVIIYFTWLSVFVSYTFEWLNCFKRTVSSLLTYGHTDLP